jgi:hypothetical protein
VNDPLPSWRPGQTKTAILGFVRRVTEPGESFVPSPERVAVFDDNGTLWHEPLSARADVLPRRWTKPPQPRPTRAEQQYWKAVIEDDQIWLASILDHAPELTYGAAQACDGIPTEALDNALRAFFDAARHPVLGVPDTKIAYRPMCELVALLEATQFQVYVYSAGDPDLVRVVSVDMCGISRGRIIDSDAALKYQPGNTYRAADVRQPIGDGPAKAARLWSRTGGKPLLAGGTADGDTAMLAAAHFALMICHDDAQREFAYQGGTPQALAEAAGRGWIVASMKDDFKEVF